MPGGLLLIPVALCWGRIGLQDLHLEIELVRLIHFVRRLLRFVPVSHLGFLAKGSCCKQYPLREE